MVFHMQRNYPKQMIHICKEWLNRKNILIRWDLWKCPNLHRWRTFKKHMIYCFFNSSMSDTIYITLNLSRSQVFLNRYIYILILVAKGSVLFLGSNVLSNKKPSVHFFSVGKKSFHLISIFHSVFPIIGKMTSITVCYTSQAQ